ncbi:MULTISPECIES: hypothetical protein [Acidiphilium]|uniref:Uncharacterized protein n=1 Tax=Acidiphilium rubrum TaxID=526 RepID=A0A8G2CJ86_ACIRU|nr:MULTISPECIES: hypothetical protein [Acidiphilium]SIQ46716.1 hypothetical protein SAMN05421828_10534 [Acidiphilium rubrum]
MIASHHHAQPAVAPHHGRAEAAMIGRLARVVDALRCVAAAPGSTSAQRIAARAVAELVDRALAASAGEHAAARVVWLIETATEIETIIVRNSACGTPDAATAGEMAI